MLDGLIEPGVTVYELGGSARFRSDTMIFNIISYSKNVSESDKKTIKNNGF